MTFQEAKDRALIALLGFGSIMLYQIKQDVNQLLIDQAVSKNERLYFTKKLDGMENTLAEHAMFITEIQAALKPEEIRVKKKLNIKVP